MGEAKRRAKLNHNFGQKYPAKDLNWIFSSASDEIVIGSLNECLLVAGVTNTNDCQNQYINPLTSGNLDLQEKLELLTSAIAQLNFEH